MPRDHGDAVGVSPDSLALNDEHQGTSAQGTCVILHKTLSCPSTFTGITLCTHLPAAVGGRQENKYEFYLQMIPWS